MPFHIHFPRPLHGWKAFLNEIAVIVIGVLIAQGLEAGVEQLHWRSKAEDGRQRLKPELLQIAAYATEHIVTVLCVESQLRALEQHILTGGGTMEPMPIVPGNVTSAQSEAPGCGL